MNLTAVTLAVRQHLGLSTSDTAVTDAVIAKLAYAAQRKTNTMLDWPWLHKTDTTWTALTTGQSTYTAASDLASDWRKTLHIFLDTDQPLIPRQKQDILRYLGTSQNARPVFYAAEGNEIIVAPAPDAAYAIRHEYIHEPAEVTVGGTEFATYEWAIDLIIDYTSILAARRLRDPELARLMQTSFAETYRGLVDEVRRTRQLPTPRHRTDIGWP